MRFEYMHYVQEYQHPGKKCPWDEAEMQSFDTAQENGWKAAMDVVFGLNGLMAAITQCIFFISITFRTSD